MTYGMLAAQSCLLTDIVDQLHENSKKVNSVERLTRHLNRGIPKDAQKSYLAFVRTMVPKNPVIHIDDSDVIKPEGLKFEALGLVRDGSKSTKTKNVYEKGYHVTEACVLAGSNHPVSIFSKIHSSEEKTIPLLMMLLSLQWNVVLLCLAKQPLSWIVVTMITRCS